jgi:hypothetical protein
MGMRGWPLRPMRGWSVSPILHPRGGEAHEHSQGAPLVESLESRGQGRDRSYGGGCQVEAMRHITVRTWRRLLVPLSMLAALLIAAGAGWRP